mgnify:CR=1 FL=1
MDKTYNPSSFETDIYNDWLGKKYFSAKIDKNKKPFTIIMSPPNITSKLHMGHAFQQTIQDIIIRRKRMQGFDALWLPGMDHAGIATQAKVDAKLKEQGISRYDIGREKFLEVAWEWKHEYATHIRNQWAALGLSLDYTKERFTLDEDLNKVASYEYYAFGIIKQQSSTVTSPFSLLPPLIKKLSIVCSPN